MSQDSFSTIANRYRDDYRDREYRRSRSRSVDRDRYRSRDRDYRRSMSPDYSRERGKAHYDDEHHSRSRSEER